MSYPEIMAGVAVGGMVFLLWQGFNIMPVLLLAGFAAMVYYVTTIRGGKSFAVIGRGPAAQDPLSFADIGGQDVAKKELCEALDFIKDADKIKSLGIRPLKGILLNGPPGTGKTLLARAAAQYIDSAFVAASGSEFVEMYVGVGAQRVRQLFRQARDLARRNGKDSAVVFLDEIEVLCGKRGQGNNNLEYDQTLNELLVQMDGLSSDDDVRILIIGATNRLDILDTAILRPGRFDRQVRVDLPDKKGRLAILELHTRNKPLEEDVDLDVIAADTFGFSGAHLESVANEAAILALRDGADKVTPLHLKNAVDKVIMGEKLDRLPSAAEKRRIAIHEAGHAVVSETVLPGSIASVNVASRGNALGYVRQTQQDDMYLYTVDFFRHRIAVALAGAVAEELILGNRSSGAGNDFRQAADMAKQVIHGGMSTLGIISPEDVPRQMLHDTISAILKEGEESVRAMLDDRRALLQEVAELLLEQESIGGEAFRALLARQELNHCA